MSSRKIFRWVCLIIWMIVIFMFSNQAYSGNVTHGIIDRVLSDYLSGNWISFVNFFIRKFAHLFEYFVLTMLVYLVIIEYSKLKKYIYYFSFLFCFLYSVTDEIHQAFVPGRTAVFRDCIIDCCGGLCFLILIYYRNKKRTISD